MKSNVLSSVNSPLANEEAEQVSVLLSKLNAIQKAWVSGYLAAQAQSSFDALSTNSEMVTTHLTTSGLVANLTEPAENPIENKSIVVLYGSQTGNAKGVALQLHETLKQQNINAELYSMGAFKTNQLKKIDYLLIVVSTNGEGEAPDDAQQLYDFLKSERAPQLSQVKFAIAALGDSSYQFFCKTGQDFEQFLLKVQANLLLKTVAFDVDYKELATQWCEQVAQLLSLELNNAPSLIIPSSSVVALDENKNTHVDKDHPFLARLLLNQKITSREAIKDVYHLEIDLAGAEIQYQPGDALGVWFQNDPILVAQLLKLWSLDGAVQIDNQTVQQLLLDHYEITQAYPFFIKAYADLINQPELQQICEDSQALFKYSNQHQIIDIIKKYPAQIRAEQLSKLLRPLKPRLYSIASSQLEVDQEVHLSVNRVTYDAYGLVHKGAASSYLTERVQAGDLLKVYRVENEHFRLPKDNSIPIIMLGAGTGIAPFRAFLQQRDNEQAQGKNWLFFGNTHFTQDFLYQTELQAYLTSGLLTKINLAFSRDQTQKIYLQHRLLENATELYQWLQQGAYLYICGALTMARDVEQALLTIISEQGHCSIEEAQDYLAQLRNDKRYLKDVY